MGLSVSEFSDRGGVCVWGGMYRGNGGKWTLTLNNEIMWNQCSTFFFLFKQSQVRTRPLGCVSVYLKSTSVPSVTQGVVQVHKKPSLDIAAL